MNDNNLEKNHKYIFTAYLLKSIHNHKKRYLSKKYEQYNKETFFEESLLSDKLYYEENNIDLFSLKQQIEDQHLFKLISDIKKRDLEILLRKIISERTFIEIADEIGINHKTVFSIYSRLIKKLRSELDEYGEKERN